MKLEEQVVSLELAKKLKELGLTRVSLYFWRLDLISPTVDHSDNTFDVFAKHLYPAYTASELGEMLPIKLGGPYREIITSHDGSGAWHCGGYDIISGGKWDPLLTATTEADARAKMLIYLLENNLLEKP